MEWSTISDRREPLSAVDRDGLLVAHAYLLAKVWSVKADKHGYRVLEGGGMIAGGPDFVDVLILAGRYRIPQRASRDD